MMRVCIRRGTHEIGGTWIEVESQGKRICLDIGLPLNLDADTEVRCTSPEARSHAVGRGYFSSSPGSLRPGKDIAAGDIFYMGDSAHRILKAAIPLCPMQWTFRTVKYLPPPPSPDLGALSDHAVPG